MNKLLVFAAAVAFASAVNAAPVKSTAARKKTVSADATTPTARRKKAAPAAAKKTSAMTRKTTVSAAAMAPATATAAVATTSSKASPGPASPATGSNVLTTDQQPKKAEKAWSAAFVSEITAAAKEVNNEEVKDKSVNTTNYIGLGYQATTADKIGYRHYFKANHEVKDAKATDSMTLMDPAVTWSHKAGKVLGSDAITPTLFYFAPVSDASRELNSNGGLRLDIELDYTLTPKWTVGYYLSPRQSIIPDSSKLDDKGKVVDSFSKTSYIHYGVVYYNVSDATQAYGYGGFIHRWQSSTAVLNEETAIGGLGASFAFFGGKFALNPELYFELPSVANGVNVAAGGPAFAESNLTYQMVATLAF
jgi:hypothetical protein